MWNERAIFTSQRNNRANLWNSKRKSWIQVYANVWQGADDDESRAYLCLYEFKETCKDQGRMGSTNGLIEPLFLYFIKKLHKKRKITPRNDYFVELLCLQSEICIYCFVRKLLIGLNFFKKIEANKILK